MHSFLNKTQKVNSLVGRKKFVYCGLLLVLFLFVVHFLLGSNIIFSVSLVFIASVGFLFLLPSRLSFTNIFVFGVSFNSGFAALLIKAVLWQPLQQNIFASYESFFYLFIGFFSIALCGLLSKYLIAGKESGIGHRINDPVYARRAVIPLLVFGVGTKILHTIFSTSDEEGGFGGFGSFNFVIMLAISLLIGLIANSGKRIYYIFFGLTFFIVLSLSIINNTKKEIFDLVVLLIIAIYAFNVKVKMRHIFLGGILFLGIFFVVSPIIHLMRFSFKSESLVERVSSFYDVMAEYNFNPGLLIAAEKEFVSGFEYSYSSAGSYIYPAQLNYERFLMIQPIDQIARELDSKGTMGIEIFFDQMLQKILPSVLIAKTDYAGVDLIGWKYGFRSPGSVARPVIGLTGSFLASSGLLGVIFFPLFFIFPVFCVMDYIFGSIKKNVWAVFGVGSSAYLIEREFEVMYPYLLRGLPIIIIFSFFTLIVFGSRWRGVVRY